jgi:RimJ/RimL family protein N-acetyltransferase
MFIRTERLFLRPAFPEDWREIHRGLSDSCVARMLASAPLPYTEENAREFCAGQAARGPLSFVVTLPGQPGAPVIGTLGIGPRGDEPHELGYWFARDHWGQGYATEAARGALRTARALGVESVAAGHFLENPASGRVLRKCGFAETGEIRPVRSAARGGDLVLSRRYAVSLVHDGEELEGLDAAA